MTSCNLRERRRPTLDKVVQFRSPVGRVYESVICGDRSDTETHTINMRFKCTQNYFHTNWLRIQEIKVAQETDEYQAWVAFCYYIHKDRLLHLCYGVYVLVRCTKSRKSGSCEFPNTIIDTYYSWPLIFTRLEDHSCM